VFRCGRGRFSQQPRGSGGADAGEVLQGAAGAADRFGEFGVRDLDLLVDNAAVTGRMQAK
jgi:hypothetical protein